jgi:2-aminoadipate transaminase
MKTEMKNRKFFIATYIDSHIMKIRQVYQQRMRLMIELLQEQNRVGLHWNEPKGGMFLWIDFPEGLDAEVLLNRSLQEGVAFVPRREFFVEAPRLNTIRMNFTHTS